MKILPPVMTGLIALFAISNVSRADEPAFEAAAAPVFRKYCVSCHNDQEREGGLSLVTPARIAAGGEHGSALLPGDARSSRMIRMMLGKLEPMMPPEGSKGPTPAELEALMRWIDAGAKTEGGTDLMPSKLFVPDLKSKVSRNPITDLRWSPDGKIIAVARYQTVEILDGKTKKPLFQLADHPGKVNSIRFSPDSGFLLTASGIAGLKGVALEWNLKTRSVRRRYANHSDVMYAAVYSPDGRQLATAGYDRKVLIWSRGQDDGDVSRPRWTLVGHNDAVYDLQFSSQGNVLASASGDQTVKLWDAVRGRRLDTLGQPLKEQFVTLFHPRRDFLLGAGRDNRIRQWKLETGNSATMNPLLISRFAHEASIVGLAYSKDGSMLVSSAEDKTIKLWSGDDVELISTLPGQSDVAFGISISPDGELAVGRMDGTIGYYRLPLLDRNAPKKGERMAAEIRPNAAFETRAAIVEESEPNSTPGNAQKIELPVTLKGTLFQKGSQPDADLFEFRGRKGEAWVFETNAARSKSPADTRIDILTPSGDPVTRVRLQAVRDSYFTFRGKDANTSDDFRVHNWQEMELNELLYCNGEIVKLFLYPRGPDSGFKVYPGFGTRHNFFDTTPVAHALQEPCYIVKAFPPGTEVTPNGLPVFDIPYENDDDAERILGTDSKLFFTAPADGTFLVKVSDSRGFQGEKYSYSLTARSPRPDFSVNFGGRKMKLKRGSGREFSVTATRVDNFRGQIDVLIENVPPGLRLPEKISIQANHYKAFGSCHVLREAQQPTAEQIGNIRLTAVANLNGQVVRKDLGRMEEMLIEDKPRVQARVVKSYSRLTGDQKKDLFRNEAGVVELTIQPGTTISADLVVKRNQYDGDIDFGNAESGRNLPHGVFVDNIGLNGLRIIKGQGDVREIFITAAKWVPEQTRLFHLRANNIDGETTLPIRLRVEKQMKSPAGDGVSRKPGGR